jgi:hypothetical protein
LLLNLGIAAPLAAHQPTVHTQPFAFRAPQEDDESVKISNTTAGRSSALCASHDATGVVILSALSDFCEGRLAPLLLAGPAYLPQAEISPAFLCAARLAKPEFLFDTNKPFPSTTNSSTRRKQSTSIFLFDTNERLQITSHQPLFISFRELCSGPKPRPASAGICRIPCGLTPPSPLRTMRRMRQKRGPGARAEI